MRRWVAWGLLVALLMVGSAGAVRAQGGQDGGALPPCTGDDLRPLADLAVRMLEATSRAGRYDVDEMLGWREDLAALAAPDCAEGADIQLRVRLAGDELLIGALLLERGDSLERAAVAINDGLATLIALRHDLTVGSPLGGTAPSGPGAEPFGHLDADDVLAAFERFGLPIADVRRNAGPAGGGAPRTEAERITFTLPTIFDGGVGQALIFDAAAGRDAWMAYLFEPGAVNAGYVFIERNVIVQLSPDLDAATAEQFRAALDSLE